MLALEAVKKLVPKAQRSLITTELVETMEKSVSDPIVAEAFKDNFVTYLNVLSKGKYKMDDYISAVKYISYKLLGYSNVKAYAATFPDRYERLVRNKANIDAYASMYNSNKLVVQIYEQTIVPTYILNAPLHQEALNKLAEMIRDDDIRGMAKVKACEAILNYTKQPEVIKNELTIGIEQNDTIADLREVTQQLAETYKLALTRNKSNLKDIAEATIIDVTGEKDD